MKLFLLVSSFFVVSFGARNQCSDFNADIAILLDASDDTGQVAFNQQKQFAQSLTKWLPRVGTNCKVKVVPYSWTIDRPLVDFSKDASRWQQNNILSKANYAQRKGPRRPMVRIIAKDLIEKHFRPSETRRDAKQIVIVVTSGWRDEYYQDGVMSLFFSNFIVEQVTSKTVATVTPQILQQHHCRVGDDDQRGHDELPHHCLNGRVT